MSKCKIYNDKMWLDYLQNRMSHEEMEDVQFHLHHCVLCRNKLQQMRCTLRGIQDVGEQKRKLFLRFSPVMRVAVAITLLAVVSMGSYFFIRSSSQKGVIIITPPPAYNSLDSVVIVPDSLKLIDEKDTLQNDF